MKFVSISDTHNQHRKLNFEDKIYNDVDTIIHAGDFSSGIKSFNDFCLWFSELPFKNKILIAGNHDKIPYEEEENAKQILHSLGIIYLQDSYIVIDGIKIYGTPWTPTFMSWYFMQDEWDLSSYWDKIPEDTNILITHGPANEILDFLPQENKNVGSNTLRFKIEQLKELKYHVFGHIHESYGMKEMGNYAAINASTMRGIFSEKRTLNQPIILEY